MEGRFKGPNNLAQILLPNVFSAQSHVYLFEEMDSALVKQLHPCSEEILSNAPKHMERQDLLLSAWFVHEYGFEQSEETIEQIGFIVFDGFNWDKEADDIAEASVVGEIFLDGEIDFNQGVGYYPWVLMKHIKDFDIGLLLDSPYWSVEGNYF